MEAYHRQRTQPQPVQPIDRFEMSDIVVCPLCRSDEVGAESSVQIDLIRNYWRQFNYDIDAEFPNLPDKLVVLRCGRCQLGWFNPMIIGSSSLYAAVTEWPPYYRRDAWEWSIAIEILARAGIGSILEVGAGTGEFLAQATGRFPQLLGLEYNDAAVSIAQAKGRPVVNQRLTDLTAKPEAIVTFQVLEHLADPAAFIAACKNALIPGGFLVFAVPNDDGALGALEGNFLNLPPHHATRWRRKTFETVADVFRLDLIDHRTQPLERNLYRLYRQRHIFPGNNIRTKIANLMTRIAFALTEPMALRHARGSIGGENQLAVFRMTNSP